MALPTVKVILAVTSPIAFEPLNGSDLLSHAISAARTFAVENGAHTHLAIAADSLFMGRVQSIAGESNLSLEFIEVDPLDSRAFVTALASAQPCDIIGVHDVQRPLTRASQYHRALAGLVGNNGAARPTTAFTETLKIVGDESELTRTIDRSSMRRLSTPEMYHRSAIDFDSTSIDGTWFLPIKDGVTTSEVDADPESLRANNESEVELLEALLHWQQRVVR
jgi:2-C-methyl-D-erythritol 4-phosphate cytidylyltransferase